MDARVPSLAARAEASPAIQGLIDEYPMPNGPDNGDGTAAYFATTTNLVGETDFSTRLDHRFSGNDDFFARYSLATPWASSAILSEHAFPQQHQNPEREPLGSASLHAETVQRGALRIRAQRQWSLGAADNFGGAEPIPLNSAGDATSAWHRYLQPAIRRIAESTGARTTIFSASMTTSLTSTGGTPLSGAFGCGGYKTTSTSSHCRAAYISSIRSPTWSTTTQSPSSIKPRKPISAYVSPISLSTARTTFVSHQAQAQPRSALRAGHGAE